MADEDDIERSRRPEGAPEGGAGRPGIEAELQAAREEARQNHDRWLRERADLENLKKRAARERTETVRFANESLLRDLLPIVDNLERAVEHAAGGGNGEPLVKGVGLVLKSLRDVLERHGVRRVDAKGRAFDPSHHEAMATVVTAEHAPNDVVEEHQAGYHLHDRLLRPALVTVARAPEDHAEPADNLAKRKGGD